MNNLPNLGRRNLFNFNLEQLKKDEEENRFKNLEILINTFNLSIEHPCLKAEPQKAAQFAGFVLKKFRKGVLPFSKETILTLVRQFQINCVFLNGHPSEKVKIKCDDGDVFINKNLFCLASDFFRQMLSYEMKEKKDGNKEHMIDFSSHCQKRTVEILKKWIYSGVWNVSSEMNIDSFIIGFEIFNLANMAELKEGYEKSKELLKNFLDYNSIAPTIVLHLVYQLAQIDKDFLSYFFNLLGYCYSMKIDYQETGQSLYTLSIDQIDLLDDREEFFVEAEEAAQKPEIPFPDAPVPFFRIQERENDWSLIDRCFCNRHFRLKTEKSILGFFNLRGLHNNRIELFLKMRDPKDSNEGAKCLVAYFATCGIDISGFKMNELVIKDLFQIQKIFSIVKQHYNLPKEHLPFLEKIIATGKADAADDIYMKKSEEESKESEEESLVENLTRPKIVRMLQSLVSGIHISKPEQIDQVAMFFSLPPEILEKIKHVSFIEFNKRGNEIIRDSFLTNCPNLESISSNCDFEKFQIEILPFFKNSSLKEIIFSGDLKSSQKNPEGIPIFYLNDISVYNVLKESPHVNIGPEFIIPIANNEWIEKEFGNIELLHEGLKNTKGLANYHIEIDHENNNLGYTFRLRKKQEVLNTDLMQF